MGGFLHLRAYYLFMDRDVFPNELFQGCETIEERTARMGRFMIMQELGMFGEPANVNLARKQYTGTFIAGILKKFSNTYGDIQGCSVADIEGVALYLGVVDDVWDVEASSNTKYLQDK